MHRKERIIHTMTRIYLGTQRLQVQFVNNLDKSPHIFGLRKKLLKFSRSAGYRQYTMANIHKSANPLLEIFSTAVLSVLPNKMIDRSIQVDNSVMMVGGKEYMLKKNVHVVGFGKAVAGMGRMLEEKLHDHIIEGVLSIPYGTQKTFAELQKHDLMLRKDTKFTVYEGAKNNLPDIVAQHAAREIKTLVSKLGEEDILIVLISGGGSALLPLPHSPLSLEDELQLTELLSKNGATINDMNVVRKHIEELKGGGLAKAAQPARVLSLILSDVPGDKLDIIASGPTVFDASSPKTCLDIFKKLKITKEVPEKINTFLLRQNIEYTKQPPPAMPDIGQSIVPWSKFTHVKNLIVGNNTIATDAAKGKAEEYGLIPFVLSTSLEGEAKHVGAVFVNLAKYVALMYKFKPAPHVSSVELVELELALTEFGFEKSVLNELNRLTCKACSLQRPVCIITGGETVVHVRGQGKGGRNQELALSFGIHLHNALKTVKQLDDFQFSFLSCGTDGQDGPTDAAGAMADNEFVNKCEKENLNPSEFLENNDSYNLFNQIDNGAYMVKTGLTGTNVMDIQILIVASA